MATNLHLDEKLLAEAVKLGGKNTKRDTVNEALQEYVARRKQKKILGLFGSVDFDEDYDYKQSRKIR